MDSEGEVAGGRAEKVGKLDHFKCINSKDKSHCLKKPKKKTNLQLTISASGPPKSRNIMRTPSSDDILRRSKGCLSRTLFLTPISSVNSVKPSSMCTPKVHSFPFQLHAGENKSAKSHKDGTKSQGRYDFTAPG